MPHRSLLLLTWHAADGQEQRGGTECCVCGVFAEGEEGISSERRVYAGS